MGLRAHHHPHLPHGRLGVPGDGLVELGVVLLGHFRRGARPDGLGQVQHLPLALDLLDDLHLGLGLLVLDAGPLTLLSLLLAHHPVLCLAALGLGRRALGGGLSLGGLVDHLALHLVLLLEVDGEVDELAVLHHQALNLVLLQVGRRLVLEVDVDLGTPAERVAGLVTGDRERPVGPRRPHQLVVCVVLGGHRHVVGHEVHGVEPHAELPDQVHVPPLLHRLEEARGPGLCDGPQVVHQVVLRHPHAGVPQPQDLVRAVERDADFQLGLVTLPQRVGLGQGQEADLVQGVRGVRDEFAEEDLLLRVERVDDDVHQARHLRLEVVPLPARLRRRLPPGR